MKFFFQKEINYDKVIKRKKKHILNSLPNLKTTKFGKKE